MPPPTNAPASWTASSAYCHCAVSLLGCAPGCPGASSCGAAPLWSVRGDGGLRLRRVSSRARRLRARLRVSSCPAPAMPKYRMVSSAKMKAWMPPMNMSNSFQRMLGAQSDVERDQPDQREHDAAGEDVAEESQRQRDRLDQLLEDVEREQHRERLEEVLEVALHALLPDAVDPDADDHQRGERVGQVGVGGRRRQQVAGVVVVARWGSARASSRSG